MKKYLRLLLCIGILLQNFGFIIPVFAEANIEANIEIVGIQQGNRNLSMENDTYIVDGYEELYLLYEIENINENEFSNYYVEIKQKGKDFGNHEKVSNYKMMLIQNFSQNMEVIPFEVSLCKDYECTTKYDTIDFNLKFSYFDEMKDSNIYITDITQGGKEVSFTDNGEYYSSYLNINNTEDITFTIKGNNLLDNAYYYIDSDYHDERLRFLGSEIEEGVTFTHSTNLSYSHPQRIVIDGIRFYYDMKYYDGENYKDYYYNYIQDSTLPTYDSKLKYTNFEDIVIEKSDEENWKHYILNSKYFNKDNTLSYFIKGNGYIDNDYTIKVKIKHGNQEVYTKEVSVNGLLLNDGYNLELDSLELELNKEIETAELYKFYITVADVTTRTDFKYNSIGKDARVNSEIFFEDGKKNLSTFMGDGNYFYGSGVAETNKDAFEKYSSIYMNYYGKNFIDDEEYEYVLEYGHYDEYYSNVERTLEETLKTGKITGKELNTVGLFYQLNNYNNYKNPIYRLTIKKGNEIIYSSGPVLRLVSSPTLANASLAAKSKNLYLRTSDFSYVATRNAPLDIMISGIGFNDNNNYLFNFCYSEIYEDENFGGEQICEEKYFKGKEINNGTAKIKVDRKIDKDVLGYSFAVMCDANNYQENVAIQGGFNVTFVDSKDLFPTMDRYIIDNASDLIKNIKKNTSVKDFTDSIEVVDNGRVKIYDKTGTEEIIGNVGTGMIARVVNEYDQNILDMDVVVKGDVSGDGNISITDVVNVASHVADVKKLDGVYEIAGNVTDTGSIGLTDLVQISQDVAGIKEVQ